jgi:hypothetical protein
LVDICCLWEVWERASASKLKQPIGMQHFQSVKRNSSVECQCLCRTITLQSIHDNIKPVSLTLCPQYLSRV